MRNSLTPFVFDDALLRVHMDDAGDPWFVAKDVASVLNLQNIRQNLDELDEDEKGVCNTYTPGGEQRMLIISESGLYSLIFRSRKPEARRFRKWVTAEVLPAIRKSGRYNPGAPALPLPCPAELPELPAEAWALRPSLRRQLWQDALQTARLDGAGSEAAVIWFSRLIALMTERPDSLFDEVRAFFAACCEPAPGNKLRAQVLYEAFRRHRAGAAHMPSMKAFARNMRRLVRVHQSNYAYYCDIALRNV